MLTYAARLFLGRLHLQELLYFQKLKPIAFGTCTGDSLGILGECCCICHHVSCCPRYSGGSDCKVFWCIIYMDSTPSASYVVGTSATRFNVGCTASRVTTNWRYERWRCILICLPLLDYLSHLWHVQMVL